YHLSSGVNKTFELFFEITTGSGIKDTDPKKIIITFHGVEFLEVNISFTDKAFDTNQTLTDLNSISEIAFLHASEPSMEWSCDEVESKDDFHIVFFIDYDNYIRVYASEITLQVN